MKKLLLIALFLQTSMFAQTMRITDPGHEIEFSAPDRLTVMVNGETLTFSHYVATGNWNEKHYRSGNSTATFYIKTIYHVGPRRTFAVFNLANGKHSHGFIKID